jgi:AraC family transcriptional regulator
VLREEPSSVDRILFRGPVFQLGAFRATPEHPLFRDSGPAEYFDFVFPRTSLWIQHEGARPFVADPNVVTLYNQGQVYRRAPISPEGDKGDWISVAPATLREVIAEYDPGVAERPLRPFESDHTLSDPQTYIKQRRLFSYVMEAEQPDPLFVEEAALCLLVWVVARMYAERGGASRSELQPTPEQHDLVQRAKAFVAARATQRLLLQQVADAVGCSLFHLCRVFRRITGWTLHGYQTHLRLRLALDRLRDGAALGDLALDLGFASHSHFTAAFRRTFGMPPSRFRSARG